MPSPPASAGLADAGVAIDQDQQAEFARRQRFAGPGEGRGEVVRTPRTGRAAACSPAATAAGRDRAFGFALVGGWTAHAGSGRRDCLGIKQNAPDAPMSFKVRVVQADRTIDVPTGATILEAALDAGIDYPFGCQSGNCGACKSRLVRGEVTMAGYSEFALSDDEKARGLILACRAVPRGRCEVAWLEEDDLVAHPRRRLACRVVGLEDATHDIKRVRLDDRVGRAVRLLGRPVRLGDLRGCPPRDYSMANVPGDPVLEFHVRRTAGGATSAYVVGGWRSAIGAGRGTVRYLLPAREPSRPDHRRGRRLGPGADQVGRRARPAEGPAAAHPSLFRRPRRARPLSARPFREPGATPRQSAFHAGGERGRRPAAGAAAWCTRRWPPTSTASTAARPISPGRRRWSRRRRGCSSSAACAASTSMPTPSTPRPKWPRRAARPERTCDGRARGPRRHRHRRRPRHRPRHCRKRWSPTARASSWPTAAPSKTAMAADPAVARARRPRWAGAPLAFTDSIASPGAARQLVERAVRAFGGLDILVNNAAIRRQVSVFRAEPRDWEAVIRNNLSAAFYLLRRGRTGVGRGRDGRGRIVDIVSSAKRADLDGRAANAGGQSRPARARARGGERPLVLGHHASTPSPARRRRRHRLDGRPRRGPLRTGRQARSADRSWPCAARGLRLRPPPRRRPPAHERRRPRWPAPSAPSRPCRSRSHAPASAS